MTKSIAQLCLYSVLMVSSQIAIATTPLIQQITPSLSISGQMTADKFSKLMMEGYRSVIVNQPDHEAGNNVSINQLRHIGAKQGIAVIYQPIIGEKITRKDVETFAQYYQQLAKPILMVYRNGNLSNQLFNEAKRLGLIDE